MCFFRDTHADGQTDAMIAIKLVPGTSLGGRLSGCNSLSCCCWSVPSGVEDRLIASGLTGNACAEDDERKLSEDVISIS